jgi:tetratricopeptide (TPR) repeat protein
MNSYSTQIIKYEKILAEQPRSQVFAPLSEAYCQMGLFDKAMDILKKGIRYNPNYVLGYSALARCYFEQKQFQLDYSTLKPIVSAHRDNLKLQLLFANVAKATNNFDESLDTYKYLNFLNPHDKKIEQSVFELESQLESPPSALEPHEVSFDISGLGPSEVDDYDLDDWEQVSLVDNESDLDSTPDQESEWVVEDTNEEIFIDETPDEQPVADALFTHTLVELYLSQGYKERALDILNKILEIRPGDQLTLNKLEAITGSTDDELEDIAEQEGDDYSLLDQSLDNLDISDGLEIEPLKDFSKLILARKKDILSSK